MRRNRMVRSVEDRPGAELAVLFLGGGSPKVKSALPGLTLFSRYRRAHRDIIQLVNGKNLAFLVRDFDCP